MDERRRANLPNGRRVAALLAVALVGGASLVGCQSDAKPPAAARPTPAAGDAATNAQQARVDVGRAVELIRRRDYAGARPLLERAIVADAMYGPAHNDLGLVYFHLDRNYDAAWAFERAAKLMPRRGEPLNNLGLVYERAEKWPEAEAAYQSAFDLEPANTEFAGNLARVRIRRGERDEATRSLLQLILMRDARAAWIDWARVNLHRLPATAPAAVP